MNDGLNFMNNLSVPLLALVAALAACGPRGRPGPQGPAGAPGADGVGCTVITLLPDPEVAPNGGAQVTCGTGAPVLVLNGQDAPTAIQVVAIVDPCGNAEGILDEIFFKLSDGRLIASFSDSVSGTNTRLSVVPVGVRLQTTDGSGCRFEVNAQGDVLP